jgi:hypothetical protein
LAVGALAAGAVAVVLALVSVLFGTVAVVLVCAVMSLDTAVLLGAVALG